MNILSKFIEQQKEDIYREEDFLEFLCLLHQQKIISEEEYQKAHTIIVSGEVKNILQVLTIYELASWLEWPFVILFWMYFVVWDVDFWKELRNMFSSNDSNINLSPVTNYFLAIVPVVMGIRYATLKITMRNMDMEYKEAFCILWSHPFPTTLTWIWAFTFFLPKLKFLYGYLTAYQKTKGDVAKILNSDEWENREQAVLEFTSKVSKIL